MRMYALFADVRKARREDNFLCLFLPYHIIIQLRFYLMGRRDIFNVKHRLCLILKKGHRGKRKTNTKTSASYAAVRKVKRGKCLNCPIIFPCATIVCTRIMPCSARSTSFPAAAKSLDTTLSISSPIYPASVKDVASRGKAGYPISRN